MEHRTLTSQLAEDFSWLEEHSRQQPPPGATSTITPVVRAVQASQLRLAAALVRNCIGPRLNEQSATPLHVVVVGGAGAGKSTVANMISGAPIAEANPQAGFTRHPVVYTSASGALNWTGHLGFLGPLRRAVQDGPSSLDADVYQVRRIPHNDGTSVFLKSFVVWDTPDMTTWAASPGASDEDAAPNQDGRIPGGYVTRLLEVSALADVLVYVASDERYNDEVPTQFLYLLLQTGKPVVVVLTKMQEEQAQPLVEHFQHEVVRHLPPGIVSCLTVPFLTADQLADLAGEATRRWRVPLINQIAVLGHNPALTRQRTIQGAMSYLVQQQQRLLDVARQDIDALDQWHRLAQTGQIEFDQRYRRELLMHERFLGFNDAKDRILELLDLPGAGKFLSGLFWVLRLPYRMMKKLIGQAFQRPEMPVMPELPLLQEGVNVWIDLLRKEAGRLSATHALWAHVSNAFANRGLAEQIQDRFLQGYRGYQMAMSSDADYSARGVYQRLEQNQGMLNTLRIIKFLVDVGAVLAIVLPGGLNWYDLILAPVAASLTHQVAEWFVQQYVDRQRELSRQRQQALMAQYVSAPMADWIAKWPTTGGSTFERLQLALRRIPDGIRELQTVLRAGNVGAACKVALFQSRLADGSYDSKDASMGSEQQVERQQPEASAAEPQRPVDDAVLRTLSPALRALERSVRNWLGSHHRFPMSTIVRATLEGLDTDLQRKADDLDVEKPLLVVLMMGGTGVGKSTLLNALAGGDEAIAQASFQRPTTRDPVVYFHESMQPDRFDPALRHCRLSPHDRPNLLHKVIVDTPDLDSNDLANREKLQRLLPVADVVLYVGSQEKYHDKLGWELFLQQRKRRAFAFVLNKWDRCLHAGGTGVRPDEDLIRDLQNEGFEHPLLFRTCAQQWVDFHKAQNGRNKPDDLPEGEQFAELMQWLELGLTRLEIEAIKARGVTQLLAALNDALIKASPPDLRDAAGKTREAWQDVLQDEAAHVAEVLVHTLEPYQREIEHHFALQGQRRFRGIMSAYLNLFNKIRYFGSTLRDRIPLASKSKSESAAPSSWDLGAFTRACSDVAANRTLDSRTKALSNRLLVEADKQKFPVNVLSDEVEATTHKDWRGQYSQTLADALHQVEERWTEPQGSRRVVQNAMVLIANWTPFLAVGAAGFHLLWKMFYQGDYNARLSDVLLLVIAPFVVAVICHVMIALLLPMRWSAIRGEFQGELEEHLAQELHRIYGEIPVAVAEELERERKKIEAIQGEVREVSSWLEQREQAATIAGLYGSG